MDGAAIVEFLAASIRIATPLLFGALGGLLSERAGTFAVGIEGMMLAGAFGGAVTTLLTADTGIGLAVSAGSGAAAGLVVAVATAKFRADPPRSSSAAGCRFRRSSVASYSEASRRSSCACKAGICR